MSVELEKDQTGDSASKVETAATHSDSTGYNVDDNYRSYIGHGTQEFDPVEAKRVLRKIDRRIVPILFGTYLLQYLDKNGINYASAYGLAKGTNLQGQDYSWLGI